MKIRKRFILQQETVFTYRIRLNIPGIQPGKAPIRQGKTGLSL
jgi:hypothetical protein